MRNKLILLCLLTLLSIFTMSNNKVFAAGQEQIYCGPSANTIYKGYIGCNFSEVMPDTLFYDKDGLVVIGTYKVENWDSGKLGTFEFKWTFTPIDPICETKSGTIKIKFIKASSINTEDAKGDLYKKIIIGMRLQKIRTKI